VPVMGAMDRIDRTQVEYVPIHRPSRSDDLRAGSQQGECTCPELCQIDHDN